MLNHSEKKASIFIMDGYKDLSIIMEMYGKQ